MGTLVEHDVGTRDTAVGVDVSELLVNVAAPGGAPALLISVDGKVDLVAGVRTQDNRIAEI